MSKKYKVTLETLTPEFHEVEIVADALDEAEDKAVSEIEKFYPEAIDTEVTGVVELHE